MTRYRRRCEVEAVASVMESLPAPIRSRLNGVGVITEYSPLFLGLHDYETGASGFDCATWTHCAFTVHQKGLPRADREPTIVLLGGHCHNPLIVLHELGHALDEKLGFPSDRLPMVPLDDYAATTQYEAFATGFCAWLTTTEMWETLPYGRSNFHPESELRVRDPAFAAFFDNLCAA